MRRLGLTKKCSGFRLPSGLSIGNFQCRPSLYCRSPPPCCRCYWPPLSCRRLSFKPKRRPPGPAAGPVERPAVSERSQDEAKGLERQLPEDGQQILKAGDESFLTLWLPANTAEAEGVVILVPGDGESPDWPQAIGPLRRKLPDAGWQTLSLALPDPQSTAPVTRPAESAASASADKDASAADSASKPDVKGESGNAPAPESTAEAGSGEPAQSEDQAPPQPSIRSSSARRTPNGSWRACRRASTWPCSTNRKASSCSVMARAPIGRHATWRRRSLRKSTTCCWLPRRYRAIFARRWKIWCRS